MKLSEAQADVRRAYVGGGPGAIVSGFVWLAAGLVEAHSGTRVAFAVLFFAGMLIFPLSKLAVTTLFRRAGEAAGNRLPVVALESTVAMIGGLFAAWLLLESRPDLALPVAAIAVGTHYAAFNTAYGDRTYWLLAALLTGAGTLAVFHPLPLMPLPFWFAGIEIGFGILLTLRATRAASA
ncbi:hypothetical protein ABS767_14680 [Sphingomonas sp. ST-64]|uniref:Uncharacterized protein n=1 Tax=Sphingomonas plantiphila TaxID=3163295 RepID=A0ABW8YQJ3_9SPHN